MVNLNRRFPLCFYFLFLIEEEHVYGYLLPEAIKFCRVLASHGSTLAFNLIDRYGLNKRLRNHLVAAVK